MEKSNGVPKNLIVGLIIIVTASIFSGYLLVRGLRKSTPPAVPTPTPLVTREQEQTLEDEWGFRLSYPVSLTAQTATKSGELTRWEFTSKTYTGSIAVWTKETDAEAADDWITEDKDAKSATVPIDSTLGGELAKKLSLGSPPKIMVISVNSGQVFGVELTLGDDRKMEKAYNSIVSSFTFLPFPTEASMVGKSPGTAQADEESDIFDEGTEEVVE